MSHPSQGTEGMTPSTRRRLQFPLHTVAGGSIIIDIILKKDSSHPMHRSLPPPLGSRRVIAHDQYWTDGHADMTVLQVQ